MYTAVYIIYIFIDIYIHIRVYVYTYQLVENWSFNARQSIVSLGSSSSFSSSSSTFFRFLSLLRNSLFFPLYLFFRPVYATISLFFSLCYLLASHVRPFTFQVPLFHSLLLFLLQAVGNSSACVFVRSEYSAARSSSAFAISETIFIPTGEEMVAVPRDEPPWSCKSYKQSISACRFRENKSLFFFFNMILFFLFCFGSFLLSFTFFFLFSSSVCSFLWIFVCYSRVRLAGVETEKC